MKQKLKQCKGITLVSLVVTVVILIILAGISIKIILGENGLIEKAKGTKPIVDIATASISGTTVTVMSQNMAETAKIVVTSATNGEYAQGKAIYTAIVENGEITLTADAYTGKYDGKDHDAVSNVVVTPSDAKLEYSTDEGKTFSTTIPKVKEIGKYSVIIKASKAGYITNKYLNKTYATDARCIGSVPTLKNGIFVDKNSENVGPVKLEFESKVEGVNKK